MFFLIVSLCVCALLWLPGEGSNLVASNFEFRFSELESSLPEAAAAARNVSAAKEDGYYVRWMDVPAYDLNSFHFKSWISSMATS